jgi:HEPN domain-containing protein
MSDIGKAEFKRVQELAWGLVHNGQKPNFVSRREEDSYCHDWSVLAYGFKEAADQIATLAFERWPNSSHLWHPLCFNYRHYVELTLKGILSEQFHNVPFGHDISKLWRQCRSIFIEELHFDEIDMMISEIDAVVEHLHKFDPKSTAFRYPAERQSDEIEINIYDLVYFAEIFEIAKDSLLEEIRQAREAAAFLAGAIDEHHQ